MITFNLNLKYLTTEFVLKLVVHAYISGESTWIGLTDIFVEGQWKWLNRPGKTTFEKWSSGEPNDFQTSEHCAALWSRANYTWFDTNCERKLPSICEKNPQ